MITLFLIDDHNFIREGLTNLIKQTKDLKLLGTASTGQVALETIPTLNPKPDIILLDIFMPDMSGLETLEKLLALIPDLKVIALTSAKDELLIQFMHRGGKGYISKNMSLDKMSSIIKNVYQGKNATQQQSFKQKISNSTTQH